MASRRTPTPNPSPAVGELHSSVIEATFAPHVWLRTLIEPDALESIRERWRHSARRGRDDALKGFTLLLAACLLEFVDHVIQLPETIDIPSDQGLADAWQRVQNTGRDSISELSSGRSPLSHFLRRAARAWDELRSTNSWEEIEAPLVRLQEYSEAAMRGFRFAYRSSRTPGRRGPSALSTLSYRALEWVWPTLGQPGVVSSVYSGVFLTEGRTSTHDGPPDPWAGGYSHALRVLIMDLAFEGSDPQVHTLIDRLEGASTWPDLHRLARELPLRSTSVGPSLKKKRHFPVSSRCVMLLTPSRPTETSDQVFRAMGSPLKLVESDVPRAAFGLRALLRGAVVNAREHGETVSVVRFKHVEEGRAPAYSLALRMEARSPMSNASRWWVFYDAYDEDRETNRFREIVENALGAAADSIELVEHQIGRDELLNIADNSWFTYLKEQLSSAKDVNAALRGALPELTVAAMLAERGLHPVRLNLRPNFLRGKEIDVAGARWTSGRPVAFWVVECKGQSVHTDTALREELGAFFEKVTAIRGHRKAFAAELGLDVIPPKVRATFVSMAEFHAPDVRKPQGIDLWDYQRLLTELRKSHVPQKHLGLLQSSLLTQTVVFGDGMPEALFRD